VGKLICLSMHHKTLYMQLFPLKWEFFKTLHACLLVFTIWRYPYHYRSLIGPFLKQKIAIFHLQYFIKNLYVHFEWELFKTLHAYLFTIPLQQFSWTIFERKHLPFSLWIFHQKVCMHNFYIWNGNTSKLCMFAYYRMKHCILLLQLDWTMFDRKYLPFSLTIFHQRVCMHNSSYTLNGNTSKLCMLTYLPYEDFHIITSVWFH